MKKFICFVLVCATLAGMYFCTMAQAAQEPELKVAAEACNSGNSR